MLDGIGSERGDGGGGLDVDPVTLIAAALAAGVSHGLGQAATSAITDAYAVLKRLVKANLAGQPGAEIVLRRHSQNPSTWHEPLVEMLRASGAASDEVVIAAAQRVMELVDAPGAGAGRYSVDARVAQGVQLGDHNVQSNQFDGPAPEREHG
jgi:hypothetical protein